MRAGTMDDNIEAISEGWLEEMRRKWPADTERTVEDYQKYLYIPVAKQNLFQ